MRKKCSVVALCAVLSASSSVAEQMYSGKWKVDNNRGGSKILFLGNKREDTYLELRHTKRWCGQRVNSYANMRTVMTGSLSKVRWWIDSDCGEVVRVCVVNIYANTACASYLNYGWK